MNFVPIVGPPGSELNCNKFAISCKFDPLQVKWWYHMFSRIKMEEYMEPELYGTLSVKMDATYIVLGSLGTHFMHTRVNSTIWIIKEIIKETTKILAESSSCIDLIFISYGNLVVRIQSLLVLHPNYGDIIRNRSNNSMFLCLKIYWNRQVFDFICASGIWMKPETLCQVCYSKF